MSTCKIRCFVPVSLPLGTISDEALIWSYMVLTLHFTGYVVIGHIASKRKAEKSQW